MKTDERTGVDDARVQTELTQKVGTRLLPREAKKSWWRSLGRGRDGAKA